MLFMEPDGSLSYSQEPTTLQYYLPSMPRSGNWSLPFRFTN